MEKFEVGDMIEVTTHFFCQEKMHLHDMKAGLIQAGTHGLILSYGKSKNYFNILFEIDIVKNVRIDWIKKLQTSK
jgi:hypothetical protein